jgi:hypothetical protein
MRPSSGNPVAAITSETTQMTKKIAREQARLVEAQQRLEQTHATITVKRLFMRDALTTSGNRDGLQAVALRKVQLYCSPPA